MFGKEIRNLWNLKLRTSKAQPIREKFDELGDHATV